MGAFEFEIGFVAGIQTFVVPAHTGMCPLFDRGVSREVIALQRLFFAESP